MIGRLRGLVAEVGEDEKTVLQIVVENARCSQLRFGEQAGDVDKGFAVLFFRRRVHQYTCRAIRPG